MSRRRVFCEWPSAAVSVGVALLWSDACFLLLEDITALMTHQGTREYVDSLPVLLAVVVTGFYVNSRSFGGWAVVGPSRLTYQFRHIPLDSIAVCFLEPAQPIFGWKRTVPVVGLTNGRRVRIEWMAGREGSRTQTEFVDAVRAAVARRMLLYPTPSNRVPR